MTQTLFLVRIKEKTGGMAVKLNLNAMTTESRNPNTMQMDTMSALEIVTVMNREDEKVPQAIRACLPQIARCAEMAGQTLRSG